MVKITRRVFCILIISLAVLVLIPFLAINLPPIQKIIVERVTEELSKTTGSKIAVDNVSFNIFGSLSIGGLYAEDSEGDTMIFARKVDAHFSPLKLFERKVLIDDITFTGIAVNALVDSLGKMNLSVLDVLFSPPKNNNNSKWLFIFQINDIKLIDSRLTYRNLQIAPQSNGTLLDVANIALNDINGRFTIYKIDKNYYKGKIVDFSFVEKSGLRLDQVQTSFLITDSLYLINDTKIVLPHSQLSIDSILLDISAYRRDSTEFGKTKIALKNLLADIAPNDLSALNPVFSGIDTRLMLNLSAEGRLEDLSLNTLNLKLGNSLGMIGNVRAVGLPDIRKTYLIFNIENLYGTTSAIQDIIANLSRQPLALPSELLRVNKFSYRGKIGGYLDNIKFVGNLSTDIGTILSDINIKSDKNFSDFVLDGHISTEGLNLARIVSAENKLSNIVFDAYATVRTGKNIPLESVVDAKIKTLVFNGYEYSNIGLDGQITKNRFEGNASLDDENAKIRFHGLVDLSKEIDKTFHFDASIRQFRPNKLRLIEEYDNLELNLKIDANFTGNKLDNINGTVQLDSILIRNIGNYSIDKINITSKTQNDSLVTLIESDLINGYVSGKYSLAKVPADVMNMVKSVVPILRNADEEFDAKYSFEERSNLGFYLEIEPLEPLCNVLQIAWRTTEKSTISGFYNGDVQMFNLGIEVPQITNGTLRLRSTRLNCYNNANNIKFIASSSVQLPQDSILVAINSEFENDSVNLILAWKNFDKKNVLAGEIVTNSKFSKDIKDALNLNVNILPTQIEAKNKIFDVKKSSIFTDFKTLKVNHFAISNNNQSIKLNGIASKLADDHLELSLNDIDLGFLTSLLPDDALVSFGGYVTGKANLSQVFERPIAKINISSDNFIFNGYSVGKLNVASDFNHNTNSLDFDATLVDDSTKSFSKLDGKLFIFKDSLLINGDVKNLRLQFLEPFIKTVVAEVDGYGTGKMTLCTNLKNGYTTVETKAAINQARLKIDILGSNFFFSDTLVLTKDSILVNNIELFDSQGNKAKVNGYMSHSYFNKNIKYKIDVEGDNILIFNRKKSIDLPFFGQAYATGAGSISGTDTHSDIVYNATVEPNTRIVIALDDAVTSTSNNFVSFITPADTAKTVKSVAGKSTNVSSNEATANIQLNVNVNPNAQLQLLIDQSSGDMIQAQGEGILSIGYNSKTEDLSLKGAYTLTQGKYLFTFQQALEREFTISPGSTLVWSGDPQNPAINLKAIYKTKASVKGLFDQSAVAVSSNMIPVNCILNLTGDLTHPEITFDIELPNSNDDVRRALKNVITTDEMMNRQMIFLLAFGRFYNPNANQTATGTTPQNNQTQSDVLALVASTLGSQLNNMLSQISDKFTIGVNIKLDQDQSAGTRNNEYGVNINYSPTDRLVISSSLGYREDEILGDNTQSSQNNGWNNAILDFELEYKLNQSGKLAIEVYNRTNSIQDFKDAPYTQGVGLIYQESFNSIRSLIAKNRKQKTKSKKQKKQKNDKEAVVEEKKNKIEE